MRSYITHSLITISAARKMGGQKLMVRLSLVMEKRRPRSSDKSSTASSLPTLSKAPEKERWVLFFRERKTSLTENLKRHIGDTLYRSELLKNWLRKCHREHSHISGRKPLKTQKKFYKIQLQTKNRWCIWNTSDHWNIKSSKRTINSRKRHY